MAGERSKRVTPKHGRPRRTPVVAVVLTALVVAVVGLVVVVGHAGPGHGAGSGRSFAAAGGPSGQPPVASTPTGANGGAIPGVSTIGPTGSFLVIASLGVRAPLVPTGATGAVEKASLTIPDDVHTAAWWDGTVSDDGRTVHEDAPAPGQPGVAVIAGHIDSATAGPGALYDLKDVKVGATVDIVDSDGYDSRWTVSRPPETTLKTELPAALWVTKGRPTLAVVTCGGPFDPATGHYLDNVIVWATPADGRGVVTPD
jgi:hypothetical protein